MDDSRTAVRARWPAAAKKPGDHLRAWRAAAADAARLALHGLLQQRLRRESVSRQSRLRRAVGELPARHRLRPRLPPSRPRGPAGRVRVSGRAGRGEVSCSATARRGSRQRIGIWGGSYGGYLTALALARNSDIFKAGVDLHGVHDWSTLPRTAFGKQPQRYEKGDLKQALNVAWRLVTRCRDGRLEIARAADPGRRRPQRALPARPSISPGGSRTGSCRSRSSCFPTRSTASSPGILAHGGQSDRGLPRSQAARPVKIDPSMDTETDIPGGVVHDLPGDLKAALKLRPQALATWEDITPLARNEWICWIVFVKKPETRRKRIDWGCSSLTEGKRRPVLLARMPPSRKGARRETLTVCFRSRKRTFTREDPRGRKARSSGEERTTFVDRGSLVRIDLAPLHSIIQLPAVELAEAWPASAPSAVLPYEARR